MQLVKAQEKRILTSILMDLAQLLKSTRVQKNIAEKISTDLKCRKRFSILLLIKQS